MKVKGSFYAVMFFLLLGLFGIINSLAFRYWESMALPLAVSSIIFIMAAVEVGKELLRKDKCGIAPEEKLRMEIKDRIEMQRSILVFSWISAFILFAFLFGFHIVVPIFTFAYLKWRRRSWITAMAFTIFMLAFIYGTFELGLNAPLFKGLILGSR